MDEQLKEAPAKTSPKDIFLHLFAIVTLYASAISFLTLVFQLINVAFPDPLDTYGYAVESAKGTLRFAAASLIVVFPVHIWAMWLLNKGYAATPYKRNLRIRKWLIYFTLFVAGIIIMGNLVTLLYRLLDGDLTMRFALKILTVFLVAGSVFWYYYWDLKKYNVE